jgi:hypothetical protein
MRGLRRLHAEQRAIRVRVPLYRLVAATAAAASTALLAISCGMLLAPAHSQPVTVTAESAGCLGSAQPSPPADVRAVAKDGAVVLSWEPPTDNSCTDAYVIDVYDGTADVMRSGGSQQGPPLRSSSTDALNYTVSHTLLPQEVQHCCAACAV